MGQTISSVKDSLQQDAEKEKRANDALNSLQNLATTKLENFYTQIRSPAFDTALLPIDFVIDKGSLLKCSVSEEVGPIADEINTMFSDFASGDVGAGISKVLSSGLKLLFGNYAANSSSMTKYTIACGDLGGVYRLDMHMFAYQYTSEQLTSITKNVLAVSVVMSSVDITKLNSNTLRTIIQKCYSDPLVTVEEKTRIYNQVWQNIDKTPSPAKTLAMASFSTRVRRYGNEESNPEPRPEEPEQPAEQPVLPPRHALQRSLNLGIARSNGSMPLGLDADGNVEKPDPSSGNYRHFQAATLQLTFDVGQAAAYKQAMQCYVLGALAADFHNRLLVLTAHLDDDTADQHLMLTVDAVHYVQVSSRMKHGKGEDHDFLFHKLDECLAGLVSSLLPLPPLRAYRFMFGREDDTPAESHVMTMRHPTIAEHRKLAEAQGADGGDEGEYESEEEGENGRENGYDKVENGIVSDKDREEYETLKREALRQRAQMVAAAFT